MSQATEAPAEISIEVKGGPQDGLRHVGAGPEIHIGRSPGGRGKPPNDLILSKDSYSSSSHARVFHEDGRWFMQDLGSTNFSKVRGKTLKGDSPPELLETGEHFVVGNTVLEFSDKPRRMPETGSGSTPVPSAAARMMLERARQLAAKSCSTFVSVEHVFAVLAESDAPVVADFFSNAKLNPAEVARQALEYDRWTGPLTWIGRGALYKVESPRSVDPKDVAETPRGGTLLAIAEKARSQTKAPSIEPMHLLTAILQEGGSVAVKVLREMGQDTESLSLMAIRLTTAHFAPEEEEPEGGTKTIARPKPKAKPKRQVDHGAWVEARVIADELLASQVQYQMAEPAARFDALRAKFRESMSKVPPARRQAINEQLRLMMPISEDAADYKPPGPPEEMIAPIDPTPAGANGAPPQDDHPLAEADVAGTASLLKEIFDTKNLGKTLGLDESQADNSFLKLAKLFYEFALNNEQFTKGVLQTNAGGGGGESRYFLPFQFHDLKSMIQKLLSENDPDAVEDIRNYLTDLSHWQISLISAYEKAANEWNQEIWDRISPAAIRNASSVSAAIFKIGGGRADLWQTFEKKVRDLHPEVSSDQFHQLVNSMTTQEFRKMSQSKGK